jgi:uncharacterized protein YbaR (Trm112 family)
MQQMAGNGPQQRLAKRREPTWGGSNQRAIPEIICAHDFFNRTCSGENFCPNCRLQYQIRQEINIMCFPHHTLERVPHKQKRYSIFCFDAEW